MSPRDLISTLFPPVRHPYLGTRLAYLLLWRGTQDSQSPQETFILGKDIRDYIVACTICARPKTSNSPLAGYLLPLPTPSRPWSHVAVDFVTGLPPSHGHTVIVDCFSKSARFVTHPQLPTATETADILVDQVFCHHGIPSNIVLDRGPQFNLQVWKDICSALGATASLTSGYQPAVQWPGGESQSRPGSSTPLTGSPDWRPGPPGGSR